MALPKPWSASASDEQVGAGPLADLPFEANPTSPKRTTQVQILGLPGGSRRRTSRTAPSVRLNRETLRRQLGPFASRPTRRWHLTMKPGCRASRATETFRWCHGGILDYVSEDDGRSKDASTRPWPHKICTGLRKKSCVLLQRRRSARARYDLSERDALRYRHGGRQRMAESTSGRSSQIPSALPVLQGERKVSRRHSFTLASPAPVVLQRASVFGASVVGSMGVRRKPCRSTNSMNSASSMM